MTLSKDAREGEDQQVVELGPRFFVEVRSILFQAANRRHAIM